MIKKEEFENIIKKSLSNQAYPKRASLLYTLRKLDPSVTESEDVRYNRQTVTSNIISNSFAEIIGIWKSKRLVLVPSLILLLFVGAFSLSPHKSKENSGFQELVDQDASILEENTDYDDPIILTSFDEPSINDLGIIQNEI